MVGVIKNSQIKCPNQQNLEAAILEIVLKLSLHGQNFIKLFSLRQEIYATPPVLSTVFIT